MDELTDLVLRCQAGAGIEELNKLLEAAYPHIVLSLRAYCGNDPNISDFAQETLRRIVEKIRASRAKTFQQFCSWCATIARHIAADHYRSPEAKKLSILDPDEIQQLREAGVENDGPTPGLSNDADRALAVLAELGSPCRELLTLYYIHGLDYEDIAEMMGKSFDAVRVAIARCRQDAQAKFERKL